MLKPKAAFKGSFCVSNNELIFQTTLNQPIQLVKERFNEDLFRFLAPVFPRVKIKQYDGQEPGSLVWVELNFFLFTWNWKSLIKEKTENDFRLEFTDFGLELPPFLSEWKHVHRLESHDKQTVITDHIQWKAGQYWPELLVRLMLWVQFRGRPAMYRAWFGKADSKPGLVD